MTKRQRKFGARTAMERWSDLVTAAGVAEEELDDALVTALGYEPRTPETWPQWLDDWHWDWYDRSADVDGIPEDFTLTDTGRQVLRDAGIWKVWRRQHRSGPRALLFNDNQLVEPGAGPAGEDSDD